MEYFTFEGRPSDSPFVERIWRTQSGGTLSFISAATNRLEMVITRQQGHTTLTVRGPETYASPAPVPQEAEFLGIVFKPGAFMPHLPTVDLADSPVDFPEAARQSFWLCGSTWQFPDFENADTFIERLVRQELLVYDPIVEAALRGPVQEVSLRSVQRRFLRATGLSQNAYYQIERARQAAELLEQGIPILDTVEQLGYADQPHLTRMLKRLIGQTPAQILRREPEAQSTP